MRVHQFMTATVLASSVLLIPPAASAAPAPNGDVAFECTNAQSASDICVTDPATGNLVNLTNDDAADGWPSWSPDGSQIAFGSDYGIDIMNADGSGRRHLVGDFTTMALEPAWSPDGTRIAYVSARDGGGFELFTIAANGDAATITRLTTTEPIPNTFGKGIHDVQPTWSPDSSQIAFVSTSRTIEDACDVYAMAAADADGDGNGDGLRRLTHDDSFNCSLTEDINPAWSPQGGLIAYSSVASGNADIWVMNPDGTGQRNISNDPSWDWMPGWSPDGTQVTFTSGRDGDDEIYSQPIAGPVPGGQSASRAARASTGLSESALVSNAAQARQLTFNDTSDRLSDWGAGPAAESPVDARPASTITRPKRDASVRAHRGVFHGSATDDLGVSKVQVALMRRIAPDHTRWWNGTRFVRGSATAPIWLGATGTGSWTYSVGKRLPVAANARSKFVLLSRAIDTAAQVETQRVAGVNRVRFWIDESAR